MLNGGVVCWVWFHIVLSKGAVLWCVLMVCSLAEWSMVWWVWSHVSLNGVWFL